MEKDFIDEFITSKDTRAYLHSIHHEFTDIEKATIVANHIMISYEEKVKWLKQFMDEITDDVLRNRILKAISQIMEEKQYYNESNIASGNIPYSESLSDFIFIPHNFRHGDIVRSLYGNWNTTMFNEKIGIILGYFDDDYELYKNLRGDYSDVQVCVDIKFDGVAYQGEFEHKHINPIYIERMSLNEKDERIAYLKYLTNLYSKNSHRINADNKPEYAGGSDDLLEQEFINPSTGKSFSSVLEVKKIFETQGIEIDDSYYEICRKTEQIKEANSSMELSQLIVEVNDEIVAKDRKIFTWGDNVEASSLYQETRAQWNTLTDKEKSLVIIEPRKAMATKALANQAYDMTQDEFGYNGLGDKSDGFRHGVWNALMTRDITRAWADLYATAHESGKTKKQLEKKAADGYKEKEHRKMDLHNNAVGRDVINWYDTFLNVSDKKLKKRVKAKLTNKSSEIYWLHK